MGICLDNKLVGGFPAGILVSTRGRQVRRSREGVKKDGDDICISANRVSDFRRLGSFPLRGSRCSNPLEVVRDGDPLFVSRGFLYASDIGNVQHDQARVVPCMKESLLVLWALGVERHVMTWIELGEVCAGCTEQVLRERQREIGGFEQELEKPC